MKIPPAVLLALTLGPVVAIGMTIWIVNDIFPDCVVTEHERLPASDEAWDLVTFSRDCGATTPLNAQAALVPQGEPIPLDADSFFSAATDAALQTRWRDDTSIELITPVGAEIFRQDESVAGFAVIYR